MGTGDYLCVTLYGGAPWGFTLREGEGDTYTPFLVTQVEEGGRAFLAGVQDGDEVVSLNGEPCVDLTLSRAFALIDTSIDCLQLLVKRHCPEDYEPEEAYCGGETGSPGQALESTTLHILSPKHRSPSPREIYISESLGDEAYHGGDFGDMVELQVSLSQQTMEDDDVGFTSLGSAHGIQGELSSREAVEKIHTTTSSTTTSSHYVSCPARVPLGQRGVVLSSHTSVPGQVEVIVQQPAASGAGRGILSVGGPHRVTGSSIRSQSEGGGGGHSEGVPGSSTVSFGIPTPAEEKGSDSEGDQDKPNKHHAKHARLRRSESLSEKHVKEAKSKCKRIALLLTAAPPNPNNKGVLMFKKHRQRAKKFTLVSYGTGEDEPEYSDEEDDETHTVEFTLVAPDDSDIEQHFHSNGQRSKGVLTINWDKGLLEIERNLQNQAEMEDLPDTKGKGALMFAQRRLRMDEISAEHEELRRCGIPVEGVPPEEEKKIAEHSYMQQSKTEAQAYMDVNMHQQSQQQQQYQQYQEQQYYEQQQNYQQQQQQQHYQQQQQQHYQQQQQQYQQQQQHYQQQQYEQQQQHYQQQQMYQQQQQECHQEQQQMQHYSANVNGAVQHQTSEMQSSLSNRTAKPFMSGPNQDAAGPGEQIASRDERISTPAIKTGLLTDAKKRNTPMFTFKEAPKVSPNPALLNLLSRSGKKLGNESEPEEDYFSLGAEACNFLQSPRVKHKTPPPVAPKPAINPNNLPWSPQMEATNQDMPQQAENSVCTPAVAPTVETNPAPELEPTSAPALEPSPLPAPQEAIASNTTTTTTEEQHTWAASHQQTLQVTAQEENVHINSTVHSEAAPVTASWATVQTQAHQQQLSTNSWDQAQVQPQEPIPSQSPPQPPWVTRQPIQTQAPPQAPSNAWAPQTQIQPSWSQPQEQAPAQTHAQPPWAQHQEQAQPQQPWTHPQGQPNWGQPQEPMQQQQQAQAPWVQPSQTDSQPQPPWVQQPQVKAQAQPPWVQPEPQPQPPWAQQPQHPAQQQAAWQQAPQAPGQPQPPWESAQPQPQQQQPPMNTWPPTQAQSQVQPPWIQAPQEQPPAQPQVNVNPWMPVPGQAQTQPPWAQHPSEPAQQPMNDWAQQQTPAQHQPPWAQPAPPQPIPQPSWQQSPPTPSTQPPLNTWPPQPAQTQPQAPVNAWAPQSQQMPANVSTPLVNTHPSPKPWQPPQNAQQDRTPPPPPQRMHSYTISQRSSSPINPMATVLNPHAPGSAIELPVVKGKGADMFAKRLSRMEMFVVDSETVQANKTSRPLSPAPSLPTEWKYTPNALGSRRYSLSPSARVLPSTGQKSTSASCSSSPTKPASRAPVRHTTSWPEKGLKAPSPWEAASRHPLGLVDEAFAFQNLQQSLATNIHMAAHRKMLPEPPAEWKARVSSHQAPLKLGSQTWSQQSQSRGQSRAPLPTSFMSPSRSPVSSHASSAGYRSLPRQWQPRTSVTEANQAGSPVSNSEFYKRPSAKQTYKSVYTSNTWSWQR